MAVSATKDFWIHPNALTITLNYFDDPQLIQTSMLAGSVILAYNKNYIGYDAAHNYREWKLQAFPTQLNDTCAYYVHAELSRDGDTAMIIYSPVKRDIEGRSFIDGAWDSTTSSASWFIYLGEISASVDADGATVERVWTDGLYTGTLATDQQRLEDAQGDWALMFQLNSATGLIDFLRTVSSATFNALTVAKNFIFGGHTFTSVASTEESGDEKKRNDATLPTTGYVQKEIEALDDHFLIKDGDDSQEVGGDVSFGGNVSVTGDHSIGGSQSVTGNLSVGRNQTIEGEQEVKGLQTLHEGFMTPNFNDAGGQVTGAQLTRDGLFSVAGLIANSFTIKELIYNVIRAQGGEYVFSPTVNIEGCVYHMKDGRSLSPDDYYAEYTASDFANIDNVTLILRDDELTHKGNPLEVGDIVYGYVNQVGESGQHATGGQCLMHVTAINELEVAAVLYQIGDRGVVANIPPAEGMTIAQRGTEDSSKTDRMTSFYISAESGSVIMLDRVQSPTLSAGNYGASFGKLPTDLLLKVKEYFSYIQETDPVVYARYGIFENLLQFDHLGRPIQRENNRGEWVSGEVYYNTVSYYDTVTYEGELWKCVADVTYDAPSNSNDWLLLVAKGKDKPMPNENLLDNTLRFDDNWQIENLAINSAVVEDGEDGRKVIHCTARSTNRPFAKQFITGESVDGGVNKVVADEWYTLSFELKGTSGGVRNVLSAGIVNESEVVYIDGVEQPYTDNVNVAATANWVLHSYTFKTALTIPADAFVGLTVTRASDFYLDKIKLERGKEVTPWSTSANDGIGKQGADGVSVEIVSTTVRYASHDSGSARPSDDKWSEILPSVADGLYLWTWTKVVYSTGDTTDSYSVSRMGVDGKGIQSAVVTYVQKENTDVQPKDFPESDWGEFPSSLIDGHWLYTRTVTTYSDGSISKSYSVTQNGQGSYYAGLQEYYAPSASPTVAPTGYPQEGTYPKDAEMTITGSWDKVRPSLSDATPYLWNFSVSFDSKGNRYVVAPVCIGNFAKGIKSIVETYAISAYSKPNGSGRFPTDISSWTDEAQDAAPTEEKPYQWNKTETAYNDDSTEQFYHVSAVKGEKGETGKDGRGINSVSMEYAVTTTFEQPSLGSDEWKSERPSTIAEGSYLWTKTIVDYTDDSVADTVGVTVSRIGANGTSVSVKKTEYVESTSATTAPTTGWSTSIPSVDEGNYLWTRTTFSDDKVAYSVAKNGKSLTIVSIKYSSVLNSSSQPAESTFTLTSMPNTKQGDYLWTLTTYSDDTKDYSKSYIPNDGVGINSTTITYGKSTSASVKPAESEWQQDIPTVGEDEYLWTRTIIDYTDSSDTVSYTYSHQGKTGQAGTSVSVKSIQYQAGDSATTAPTGTWSDNVVEVPQGGYLWTKTEFSDGSTAYGSARQGSDGKDGLTAQPNIIRNSNFDLNDGTYLKFWRNYWVDGIVNGTGANDKSGELPISEYVVSNAHEGLNAIKYNVPTPGHLFISNGDAKITIEKGFIYTFSCVAKYTGQSTNSSGGIFGVRFESLPLSAITSVGDNEDIYGVGGSNHTEIYFGKVGDEWTKRSFTFSLNDSYENDTAVFRLCGYAWGKDITVYYSQIKLEISLSATPYVKHVDDNKGENGTDGRGISSVSMEYAVTTTFDQPSLGSDEWKSERPSTIAEGSYLWTKTIVDYTDDSVADTVGVTVSRIGANGTSVSVKKTEYAESTSATTAPTTGWSTSIPSVDEGNYLWTRTTFSDGKVAYSVAKNGKSLTIVSIKYSSVLNSSSQPAESTFTLTSMPNTKQGDYLWTLTTYSDDTKDYSKSYIPNDGVGINSTTITYGKSTSASVKPAESEWQQDIPTVGEDEYLWTRTIIDYTDSSDTVSYTYSHQGKTGQAGTSVSVKSIQYQAGDSATTAPTGTWSDVVVEVPQGGYLWTKTEFSDGSTAYGSARQGSDGKDGLTPQPNILHNTNFDVLDANGNLVNWKNIAGDVIPNGYLSYNSFKTKNTGTRARIQLPTMKKGDVFTFSCVARIGGTESVYCGGITINNSSITSRNLVGIYTPMWNATDFCFKNTSEWTERKFTFEYTGDSELSGALLSLYVWGGWCEYSTIKLEQGEDATPYVKHVDDNKGDKGPQGDRGERGIEGPQGESGGILLHRGNYDPKSVYKLSRNEDGSVFGYPIVYLPAEQGLGSYLTLKKDMNEVNADGYPIDANGNAIEANNTEYWKITPYQEQVFTKFLMANYAQLGSDKGAVFFDRFLFSQYGVNKNGEFVHYTGYDDVMWNEDGTLSGEFTPALAIDMYSGYVKANKIAETFAEYQYRYIPVGSSSYVNLYANEIDFNQTYNIKYNQRYVDVCLLTMPLADDINTEPPFKAQADTAIDGLKSIVLNRADMNWERSYRATVYEEGLASGFTPFASIVAAAKSSLLLCATPKLFHPYTWYVENGVIYNDELMRKGGGIDVGYFVIDGIMTNFLLIEPGMKAVLRSCRDTDGKLYWYVENGSDFVSMPYTVYVKMPKVYDSDSASLINVPTNLSKWVNVGYEFEGYGAIKRHCFVSKSLYEIYEKLGGSMNIDIVSAGYDVDVLDDWSWEKCITSVSINSNHKDI